MKKIFYKYDIQITEYKPLNPPLITNHTFQFPLNILVLLSHSDCPISYEKSIHRFLIHKLDKYTTIEFGNMEYLQGCFTSCKGHCIAKNDKNYYVIFSIQLAEIINLTDEDISDKLYLANLERCVNLFK